VRSRRLGSKNPFGVGAIIGPDRDHRDVTIVVVVVESGQPAEHPDRLAVERKRIRGLGCRRAKRRLFIVPQRPARELHQLFGQHAVRQTPGQDVGAEQGGRRAQLVGELAAAMLRQIEVVRESVARPVRRRDHVFELVDGLRREIPRIEHRNHVQARIDRCGQIADDAGGVPFAAERGDEIGDGVAEAAVRRQRRRFGEHAEPRRAFAARRRRLAELQAARERGLERAAQRGGVGGAVPPEQERQRIGADAAVAHQRVDHAIGNLLQFRQPAVLQA
jgi:hypothetical protein